MKFTTDIAGRADAVFDLFRATFSASEGPEEGALIGGLVADMLQTVPAYDLRVFLAEDAGRLIGAIVFSSVVYAGDTRSAFVLAPVAVATDRQRSGIGVGLLRHGLNALRSEGVDVALTYGDPAYYGKVGFAPVSTEIAPTPQPLQYPEGWLGQSLTDQPLTPLRGPVTCVAPLNDPAFW